MEAVGASAELSAFRRTPIRIAERNGRVIIARTPLLIVTKDEIDEGVSLMEQVLTVADAYTAV